MARCDGRHDNAGSRDLSVSHEKVRDTLQPESGHSRIVGGRMIEDMSSRKLAPKTPAFFGRSPATAKSEDVRRFRVAVQREN
jgi:hypothetical protein